MKKYGLISLLLAVCASTGFAADVKSDYDRSFSLTKLHVFRFSEQARRSPKDALAGNELIAKRLHNAIQNNLIALGMEQQDTRADFEIVYYAGARNQVQVTTAGRPRWAGGAVWVDQYTEGTAVVEFRDAKSGELVWRGFVTGAVDPNKSEENINKGIKKLIERFAKDREKQQRGK